MNLLVSVQWKARKEQKGKKKKAFTRIESRTVVNDIQGIPKSKIHSDL